LKIRVGAVSYLNTRPLVLGFEQGVAADRIELSYDVPSVLANRMQAGELDVALLPVIEVARMPDLTIVPGLGITSNGPCRSVLLVSKKPLAEVRRVALDPESRTSNALVQVLFAEGGAESPAFALGPRDLDTALREHDAAVRIGDKALFDPLPPGATAHDLGAAWTKRTALPFVFAVWAARPAVVDRELYVAFHTSRRMGGRALDLIAEDYTWQGRRWPEISAPYLRDNMRYRLGSAEVRALRRFWRAAHALGLLEFLPEPRLAVFSKTACEAAARAREMEARRPTDVD
jgi:chorismate dehydratase